MTAEEKQLLLQDLCGRLPYGVIVHNTLGGFDINLKERFYCLPTALTTNFKPYLRPMSNMTEEEHEEYNYMGIDGEFGNNPYFKTPSIEAFEWLNAHHFDYRGLILKGLALEAPKGMYNK